MSYTLPFEQCNQSMVGMVGGKCASLGTLIQARMPVPPGFAVTTKTFMAILGTNGLSEHIHAELADLDTEHVDLLEAKSQTLRSLIEQTPMPSEIEAAIASAYAALCERCGVEDLPVAVRSSATAEDLPGASFAGQQDTFLWVVGLEAVIHHVRQCWSSLYTARAIAYRHDNGFPHEKVFMSVGVQKMVNARSAGVAMTLNPTNGDRSKIVIDSSFGLGETVVGGTVTPDNFVVDKVLLEVVKRTISPKLVEIVPDPIAKTTLERPIENERQLEASLHLDEIKAVARLAKQAEQHYGCPQDVEWALDADLPNSHNVVLLQSRPETVWSRKLIEVPASNPYQTGMGSILNTLLNPLSAQKKD